MVLSLPIHWDSISECGLSGLRIYLTTKDIVMMQGRCSVKELDTEVQGRNFYAAFKNFLGQADIADKES